VLELIAELLLKRPVRYAIKPFLERCGLGDEFTFYSPSQRQADGYRTGGDVVVPRGGLVFPCLAAGGRCPAEKYARFLWHLGSAYRGAQDGPVSPGVARRMLGAPVDRGAVDAVGARAGPGAFVARAGPNLLVVHHAAASAEIKAPFDDASRTRRGETERRVSFKKERNRSRRGRGRAIRGNSGTSELSG